MKQSKKNNETSLITTDGLDQIFYELRTASHNGNLGKILEYAISGVGLIQSSLSTQVEYSAYVAHRDLGHIAATCTRFQIPLDQVYGLTETLVTVSGEISEVPRDTVFSYGPRNLIGENIRAFTCHNYELGFIESFRKGMQGLDICLISLLEIALNRGDKISHFYRAIGGMQCMVDAIVSVHRSITPVQFTNVLRPYFDPIMINGESYLAPGGAQMPLILVDLLLSRGQYLHKVEEYAKENIRYMPKGYRDVFQLILSENIEIQDGLITDYQVTLKELLIKKISAFRYPHLAVANANFRLRATTELGSGGYSPVILEQLLTIHSKI